MAIMFSKPNKVYDPTVPRCVECNVPFPSGKWDSDKMGWCNEHKWTKGYVGPQRPNKCVGCYNNVGTNKSGQVLCAFQMFRGVDGEWRNAYGNTHREYLVQGGMKKITKLVVPVVEKGFKYICDGFDDLKGRTRQQVEVEDPLYFYSKKRFWD